MIARCCRPSHPRFEDYGGRGIQVDPSWRGAGGFERFLADVGERQPDTTLDRIDVDGHYVAANVRWSDLKTQRWNRRDMRERSPRAPAHARVVPLFDVEWPAPIEYDAPVECPF